MGTAKKLRDKVKELNDREKARVVRMAWEDRTTFDAIEEQFGLSPNDVERFMRTQLPEKDYKRWRKRANQQGHLKHREKRGFKTNRFKCRMQRLDGSIQQKK